MDSTALVTDTITKQVVEASDNTSQVAPTQHQQQGFYQVSPADNTYTANTYNAHGERPAVQAAAESNTSFSKVF